MIVFISLTTLYIKLLFLIILTLNIVVSEKFKLNPAKFLKRTYPSSILDRKIYSLLMCGLIWSGYGKWQKQLMRDQTTSIVTTYKIRTRYFSFVQIPSNVGAITVKCLTVYQ